VGQQKNLIRKPGKKLKERRQNDIEEKKTRPKNPNSMGTAISPRREAPIFWQPKGKRDQDI